MNNYQRGKEAAREMAVEFSLTFGEHTYFWSDLAEFTAKFERLGRRYGLLREFRENGIL